MREQRSPLQEQGFCAVGVVLVIAIYGRWLTCADQHRIQSRGLERTVITQAELVDVCGVESGWGLHAGGFPDVAVLA